MPLNQGDIFNRVRLKWNIDNTTNQLKQNQHSTQGGFGYSEQLFKPDSN